MFIELIGLANITIRLPCPTQCCAKLELKEGLNAGLGTAEDEGVNIVGAFIGIHRFKVDHVAHDMELI